MAAAALSPTIPSKHAGPSSPQPQNPHSLRLYKVLATNFDDPSTREALDTLSSLYGPAPLNTAAKGKQMKLDDAYDDWEESYQDKEHPSLPTTNGKAKTSLLESTPGEIAARARKDLKTDVQAKLAESSRKFLNAFAEVDKQLDTLQEHIGTMRTKCDEAQEQLQKTNEGCKSLLDRAGSLREQRQEIATRQSIITLFLSRFTLTTDEAEAITSREVPIGKRFFAAMSKAEQIRDDCQVLMAGEDGPTTAGLEIMAATSSYLEQAYEKICRWCNFEFRQMGRDAQLDVTPSMREAVQRLKQRPELLSEALSYLSQTRQSALLSSFTDALTRGGPSGLPRPIELHAHDPLRYVGDMLAWVHQAIAAEREFLEALFGVKGDGRMVGSVRNFEKSEEEEWMSELMNAAVGKLSNPLKVRVQQTIRSQESSITLYKIANLLYFYSLTMRRTIGPDALLSKTLTEITDLSHWVFLEAVQAQGRSLLRLSLNPEDRSVSPPLAILDHAQVLREIMVVYESSLSDDDTTEEQNAAFKDILDKMVDPAVEMCVTASDQKQKLRSWWDRPVFVLNTLTYLESVLEPFSFTEDKQQMLQGLIESRLLQLTEEHYNGIVADSGLGDIIEAWKLRKGNEPLSRLPAASASKLQASLHKFSVWLAGVTVDQPPRLAQFTAQALATRVHHAALARLVHTYRSICEEVKKPENRYEAAATLLGSERPFGQVHLLWQIFGIEETDEE